MSGKTAARTAVLTCPECRPVQKMSIPFKTMPERKILKKMETEKTLKFSILPTEKNGRKKMPYKQTELRFWSRSEVRHNPEIKHRQVI